MELEMIIIYIVACIAMVCVGIYVKGFKNWLVWAVTEAEATLGSGTGQLKLRYVYNLAVKAFPTMAKFLPFSVFCGLVDNALKVMREMIENNADIAKAINPKTE